jgi:polysaccharide biosynthesis protein PslH
MRLLYFAAHQLWPLTSGNRLRDYYLARELAKRASVTFVEMCHPGEAPSHPPNDSGFDEIISLKKGSGYTPDKIVRGFVGPIPLTALNYFDANSAAALASLLARKSFDTLQIEGVQLSSFLPIIHGAQNPPSILVDWHNIESELMQRYSENQTMWPKKLLAKRTATLLQRTEKALLERCTAHTVASEREQEKLLALDPAAKIHVIPNGVDTNCFSSATSPIMQRSNGNDKAKRSILFVGSMDYHANIDAVCWFATEVWPSIAKKHPELEFVIVGRNPSLAVRQLASASVRVTGTVDDVRPFYSSASAVVVPLRVGSGTRLKILEAMAAAVPVISSGLGAEGISAVHDVHLLRADSGPEILEAVDRIVTSPETSSRLAKAARDLVAQRYDWTKLGEELYRIHKDLLGPTSKSMDASE